MNIRPKTLADYWAEALPVRPVHAQNISQKQFELPQAAPEPMAPEPTQKAWIQNLIQEKSQKYDVPAELVASIIHAESAFNPHAVSPIGRAHV